MKTILVSGSDTGVGKTRVTGLLARRLAAGGARVRLLKPVESGRAPGEPGDAELAATAAGLPGEAARTTLRFAAPLAPRAAAQAEGRELDWETLAAEARATPECDWLLVEGAGGLAVPLADDGRDWADFAVEIGADAVVLVVPDRLGAINQARLTLAYARSRGLRAGVVLNAVAPCGAEVRVANREGLREVGAAVWGELAHDGRSVDLSPDWEAAMVAVEAGGEAPVDNAPGWPSLLAARKAAGLLRRVATHEARAGELNLASNDYLGLARDPALAEAAAAAAREHGTSASASPLITGWRAPHAELVAALCAWHGFAEGLSWSSGYAANAGVLGTLPRPGDLILADRLVHHSMVAGALNSGARLRRYPHLDLDALERLLEREGRGRRVFVATESVFSMDGDYPDLRRIAELRRRFGFCWVLDEAHALGWFGPTGAGLAEEQGVAAEVDVLVGTGGKALGAGGGYTLFRSGPWREALVNHAGEFIYSTGLPPPVVAAARAGARRAAELATEGQARWRGHSRVFRARLRAAGWDAPEGDSPIVPVRLGAPGRATELALRLRGAGVLAAAVRPPTVPEGSSRLRFSMTRNFGAGETERVLAALGRAGP